LKQSLAVLSLVALLATGCSTTSNQVREGDHAAGQNSPGARTVPQLKVVLECTPCQVRPNVPGLIVAGYHEAATESGAKVTNERMATLTVKEYSARDEFARLMIGALAGKDEIKATVDYEGKKFEIEDYFRNAWQGMDTLAKRIGGMAFESLR
jgi:hypothetical protein